VRTISSLSPSLFLFGFGPTFRAHLRFLFTLPVVLLRERKTLNVPFSILFSRGG